ncbi:MAG: hypothetical protein IKC11_01010 [Clostridia bacterium]|nr:hypothetical protein [Clostridia bacterium]
MKKKKNDKLGFCIRLFSVLAILVVIVFGAYLVVDKLVVPKYFKEYGINNMHDLVGMVKTLYNSPDEKEIITNGYTAQDTQNAENKLITIGFPTKANGIELDYFKIADGFETSGLESGAHKFTDREIASIMDKMLEEGVLASKLPHLNYIDTMKINILELIIQPTLKTNGNAESIYANDSASVSFTFKFETSAVRGQMAEAMDTPMFLLDMIVPKTMYITVNYDIFKDLSGDWQAKNGHIGVNGRTAKDSEILLNLLINFVFPEEENMTLEIFSNECGNILIQGLGLLGDITVTTDIGSSKANGIVLTI